MQPHVSVWIAGGRWHWLRSENDEIVASGHADTEEKARLCADSWVDVRPAPIAPALKPATARLICKGTKNEREDAMTFARLLLDEPVRRGRLSEDVRAGMVLIAPWYVGTWNPQVIAERFNLDVAFVESCVANLRASGIVSADDQPPTWACDWPGILGDGEVDEGAIRVDFICCVVCALGKIDRVEHDGERLWRHANYREGATDGH